MRILMLGNSFTTANHMPDMLDELTGAEIVQHTRGGARLAEQLNPKTKMGKRTQEALQNEKWDFVILQEMSNGPITSKACFLENAEKLCEKIRENGAKPVFMRPGHINVEERSWKLLEWIMMRCIRNCMKLITWQQIETIL